MDLQGKLVDQYSLSPHPEGGFYRETYRSNDFISKDSLPSNFGGNRNFSTAIYYLLPANTFSAFHAICSDECWHFYEGIPLNIYVLSPNGQLNIIKLGRNFEEGEVYQAVVSANCWFASKPSGESGFSFTGCTVSPGFDFADLKWPKEHNS